MKMVTCRASGEVLPYLLRKKYKEYSESNFPAAKASETKNKQLKNNQKSDIGDTKVFPYEEEGLNQSTTDDLGQELYLMSTAMIDIQKQLHRGEELYFEDTQAHGNIYRGWDAFVDLKDVSSNSGSLNQPGSYRRMPSDHRWFSGSCKSVARSSRPTPRSRTIASPSPSFPSRSNTTTPASVAPSPAPMSSEKVSEDAKNSTSEKSKQIQKKVDGESAKRLKTNHITEELTTNTTDNHNSTTLHNKNSSRQQSVGDKIPRVAN